MTQSLAIVGYASGMAAHNVDCALGPWYLYYHAHLMQRLNITFNWHDFIQHSSELRGADVLEEVENSLIQLSHSVLLLAAQQQRFCVIGGDHACGIGTWSAVAHANRSKGDIGLIWIDAHMDSHTPDTSVTQNIHGMPVAHLLGYGEPRLCHLLDNQPKIKPTNVCLIGIRSYEPAEQQFLEHLGVTVYTMEDIKLRGLDALFIEACEHVSAHTCGFGLSIDIDAIDPADAPGVGYREPGGISAASLLSVLRQHHVSSQLLGLEIAEFNPIRDKDQKTAALVVDMIKAVYEK